MERLETLDGVYIEKGFTLKRTCVSSMNVFKIYGADNQGKKICENPFLKSKEYSSDF